MHECMKIKEKKRLRTLIKRGRLGLGQKFDGRNDFRKREGDV